MRGKLWDGQATQGVGLHLSFVFKTTTQSLMLTVLLLSERWGSVLEAMETRVGCYKSGRDCKIVRHLSCRTKSVSVFGNLKSVPSFVFFGIAEIVCVKSEASLDRMISTRLQGTFWYLSV